MLKEIFEQPKVLNDFLGSNLSNENFLDSIGLTDEQLNSINKIYIVGCGTAYHAGLVGMRLLQKIKQFSTSAEVSSEFRYNDPNIDEHTLLILISQSGETADTLAALRLAKKKNAKILALVNVVGSSIAREADNVIYIMAGPEISVASTKAFSAQVLALITLVVNLYNKFGLISEKEFAEIKHDLQNLPATFKKILERSDEIETLAKKYIDSKNVFYLGRNLDYFIAMEGSLKLKEIAYLYSEAYAAGELKHGPIALMENSILVIGIMTQKSVIDKMVSNLKECKARGAKIFTITFDNNETDLRDVADETFAIPEIHWILAPLLANIPLQLFAYYMAKGLGNDIDKPRNLAKSVTVE